MSLLILNKALPSLREIRVHFCPKSANSQGVKQFIDKYYIDLKKNNEKLPILIRECTGVEPKIWFRFEYGRETSASLNNLERDQIAKLIEEKVAAE